MLPVLATAQLLMFQEEGVVAEIGQRLQINLLRQLIPQRASL